MLSLCLLDLLRTYWRMLRPANPEVGRLLRPHGPAYQQTQSQPLHQYRQRQALETCRTPVRAEPSNSATEKASSLFITFAALGICPLTRFFAMRN